MCVCVFFFFFVQVKPESEIDEAPLAGTLTVSVNLADSILPTGKTVEPGAFPTERSASDSTSMFGRKGTSKFSSEGYVHLCIPAQSKESVHAFFCLQYKMENNILVVVS